MFLFNPPFCFLALIDGWFLLFLACFAPFFIRLILSLDPWGLVIVLKVVSESRMLVIQVSQLSFRKILERIDTKANRVVASVVFAFEHPALEQREHNHG